MLLEGLEKMKMITVLDFPNNIITDESIEPLVKFLTGKVKKKRKKSGKDKEFIYIFFLF